MADLFPVAGAKIYIGPATSVPNTDVQASDFSATSFVEIADWTTMGSIGDTAALITTQVISRGRDVKQKGTRNAGQMQNVFAINADDAGQIALIAASQTDLNYPFKILFDDAPAPRTQTFTVTIASPGLFTAAAHGLVVGDVVTLSTTGALPTGLAAATPYYVIAAGLTSGAFELSATLGGAAINTTGTQSGVHTLLTVSGGTVKYFMGLVMNANEAGGAANTVRNLNSTIEINTNVVTVAPTE